MTYRLAQDAIGGPVLETARLRLRPPHEADYPDFAAFYASDRAAARGWQRDATQSVEFWNVLTHHWQEKRYGWFVITMTDTGRPIGMCGPWTMQPMPEGEIAWSLWHDNVEGKSLAYEAAISARHFTFGTLGWPTAVSYIAYDNLRSIALARRLGASQDGEWTTPKGAQVAVYRHRRAA